MNLHAAFIKKDVRLIDWPKGLDLHNGTRLPATHDHKLVVPERDAPHGIARLGQFPNKGACLEVWSGIDAK